MNFTGKTAVITGAARGIGKAIALGIAEKGGNVIITDILEEELNNTAEEIKSFGSKVKTVVLDVTDEAATRKMVEEIIAEFGQIHILVNNAGIYVGGDFFEQSSENWKRTLDVNVLGTMYLTQAIVPHMMDNKYGRVINIGSVAGVYGIKYLVDYSASKGAVIAFTKALSKITGPAGVTVNCVSPGSIDVSGGTNHMPSLTFLERSGTPEELANAVLFLASEEGSYVNGHNLLVDGMRKQM